MVITSGSEVIETRSWRERWKFEEIEKFCV